MPLTDFDEILCKIFIF